ncbi:MAG: hypothetical protein R3B93_21535 [Bacteroidia bacterium]
MNFPERDAARTITLKIKYHDFVPDCRSRTLDVIAMSLKFFPVIQELYQLFRKKPFVCWSLSFQSCPGEGKKKAI